MYARKCLDSSQVHTATPPEVVGEAWVPTLTHAYEWWLPLGGKVGALSDECPYVGL